jgi:hypothetical protein
MVLICGNKTSEWACYNERSSNLQQVIRHLKSSFHSTSLFQRWNRTEFLCPVGWFLKLNWQRQANIQLLVCWNSEEEQPSLRIDQNSDKKSKLRLKAAVVIIRSVLCLYTNLYKYFRHVCFFYFEFPPTFDVFARLKSSG